MVLDKQNTVVYNGENPSAVVFFLHGFGDSAHGWARLFRDVAKEMPHVKYVFPSGTCCRRSSIVLMNADGAGFCFLAAPRPVAIANGSEVRAWVRNPVNDS
ncbi:unnamed protein product [Phytophthora lilii]|uniref:Unnamed protein product n=1 Tax=Phytophthora lilii TaxID=2077276 RepID=A0A9W6WWB3_9STRA|nr:unnamed protein product [Phytophthora lilii]